MWTPAFACPLCRGAVVPDAAPGHWVCGSCGSGFDRRDGISRFATTDTLTTVSAFLNQYRAVRRADGHRVLSRERFSRLPAVADDDPTVGEWRIREESMRTLTRLAGLAGHGALRVLDLGAGCAWLSNRMAQLGHLPVALDIDDDVECGLGAGARWAEQPFPLVQADFVRLPFAPGQFDVVVMNASLHYAIEPERTLEEAHRMAVPGGVLVVMDSPMFERADAGEAMVAQQADAMTRKFGIAAPVRRGPGYLTFSMLQRAAPHLGRRAAFVSSDGPLGWRVRRMLSRRRLGRAPAAFGVWVAR